jgi:hypothetical protein
MAISKGNVIYLDEEGIPTSDQSEYFDEAEESSGRTKQAYKVLVNLLTLTKKQFQMDISEIISLVEEMDLREGRAEEPNYIPLESVPRVTQEQHSRTIDLINNLTAIKPKTEDDISFPLED